MNSGFLAKGTVTLFTKTQGGKPVAWRVRFKNTGDAPWVGTVTLVDSYKNSGHGFESMSLPGKNTEAEQVIDSRNDHGASVSPGKKVRLAVRGHAFIEVPLPARGKLELDVKDFELMPLDEPADDYFEDDYAHSKRYEKWETGKVTFFEAGREWHPHPSQPYYGDYFGEPSSRIQY